MWQWVVLEVWILHCLKALKETFELMHVRQNTNTANPALEQVNQLR